PKKNQRLMKPPASYPENCNTIECGVKEMDLRPRPCNRRRQFDRTGTSPSPPPSPLGRGRIVGRVGRIRRGSTPLSRGAAPLLPEGEGERTTEKQTRLEVEDLWKVHSLFAAVHVGRATASRLLYT